MSSNFKHNPRVISKPGEPLEVEVDLQGNTPDEMFDAIEEAAKLAGLK